MSTTAIAAPTSASPAARSVAEHLAEFVDLGYTIVPAARDQAWVTAARAAYEPARQGLAAPGQAPPELFDSVLESEPQLGLEALRCEPVLAIAEAIIGPHVQVESMTMSSMSPVCGALPPEAGEIPGWHRDLFALFPEDEAYRRPLLFNAMTYLQDLTSEVGPLLVIPGSHRRPLSIAAELKQRHHPGQVALHPRAGDVVLFHNALVHSASYNRSRQKRYFYCVAFNHCWLKRRNNFSGPACGRIIEQARARNDRRLLRLLGADEAVLTRALYHDVLAPEAATWAQWREADRLAMASGA